MGLTVSWPLSNPPPFGGSACWWPPALGPRLQSCYVDVRISAFGFAISIATLVLHRRGDGAWLPPELMERVLSSPSHAGSTLCARVGRSSSICMPSFEELFDAHAKTGSHTCSSHIVCLRMVIPQTGRPPVSGTTCVLDINERLCTQSRCYS